MILYNVTVKLDHKIHSDWLRWMKHVHIPDVMKTGMFVEHKICRLLSVDEADGVTYAIQYFSKDMEHYQRYQREFAPVLQQEHTTRYKGQFVAFRTLMQVVES